MLAYSGSILVVDDDSANRLLLANNLQEHGYTVQTAEDGQQALTRLRAGGCDLMLLDLLMPEMDGFQVLEQMQADSVWQHLPVIVISAVGDMESVIRCLEMGAADYLSKPVDEVVLYARINAALAAKRLHDQERDYLRNMTRLTDAAAAVEAETFEPACLADVAARPDALGQMARVFQRMAREVSARQQYLQHQVQAASKDRYRFGDIIGKSAAMQQVYEQIVHAAASDASVVITGESGTGKELVAQTIHRLSKRRDKPCVPVNCGAIPEALFEREFFGHRKGAFTGADRDTPGFFDAAHGGTLFLDEVEELPVAMQVKLLRVLQNGEYTPVGDNHVKHVDVRLIAASNKHPETLRQQGVMRADFFYRIYVMVIELPPLRSRKEDLPLLVDHFLAHYSAGQDATPPTIPGHIVGAFMQHDWPGNIRELQNVIQRYLAGERLHFIETCSTRTNESNQTFDPTNAAGVSLRDTVEAYEKQVLAHALAQHGGNAEETANALSIPMRTLYGKIKKYRLR